MEDTNKNITQNNSLQEPSTIPSASSALSSTPATPVFSSPVQQPMQPQSTGFGRFVKRFAAVMVVVAFLSIGGIVAASLFAGGDEQSSDSNVATEFNDTEIPLGDLPSGEGLSFLEGQSLTINGPLKINDTFVLSPQAQPVQATAGQLYFDQDTDTLAYYNGSEFVELQGTSVVSVRSGSPNVAVTDDGNGNVTITSSAGGGTGTLTSSGGTAGAIPKFTAAQNLENSLLSESGASINVAGSLSVANDLTLGTALSVANGGTGATSLTLNGVLIGQGTGAVTAVTGAAGECLLATAGAPAFAACPGGGGGGVSSIDGQTGIVDLANATGSGGVVTINDATTAAKGIASFNSTNFTTSSGAVNTIQNINTGATPTFAGVNTNNITPSAALTVGVSGQTALLQGSTTTITSTGAGNDIILNSADTIELMDNTNITGNLVVSGDAAVNGGDLTATGALNITPGGTLTAGVSGQTLTLQGNAATSLRATDSGNTTIVAFASPTANTTLNFPALSAGTYTMCTTSGNCAGAGVTLQAAYNNSSTPEIVLDATRGALTIRDNATPLGANLLEVQNNAGSTTYLAVTATGATVTGTATVTGNINSSGGSLQTGGTTRVDGSGNLSNIGTLTLSGAISGGTSFSGSGNINTTGGVIQTNSTTRIDNSGNLTNIAALTASGNATLQGGTVTLGTTTQAGSVVINDGSSNTGTLLTAALGGDRTYTLPDATGTFCLTSGNCLGGGSGGANTALSNLTGVAINTTLLPGAAGTVHLGSGTLPFGDVFLAGSSGTPGTNNFRVTGASTSGTRVITLPDATGTVCLQTAAACGFAPDSGSANYIQNQIASPQTSANFNIDGSGRAATFNATTGLNTGAGAGTQRVDASGNLVNIGTVTTSGAINSQTISSAANFTGTLTVQGANALTLGTTGTSTGAALFKGSTGASGTVTLTLVTNNPGNRTISLPDETGTVCTTGSVCAGYQASGSFATTALSNLAAVAINTTLLPGAAGTVHLGSGTLPFGDAFLAGTSGTPGTNNFRITGASTSGTRTITLPDATGTVCLQTAAACGFASGSGSAFVQGGNTFGSTATLGTNELQGLDIRTNSTTRMSFGSGGGVSIARNDSADELEIGDDIFTLNDGNTRLNLGNSANDSFLRLGETNLLFGFLGWGNSINTLRLGTFGAQDLRLETNSTARMTVSGAGVTTIAGTASSGVAGFQVSTTQNSTTGLQPGNILNTTLNPGGTASASYFGNQMTVDIGAAGTTFTGDVAAHLGQLNWSGASNTSNTGKLYGTVGKVVTASGAGSVQNAVALFSQLQYAVGTTVTNSYNVYSGNLQSGATTNHYGFYSEFMNGGTNNYPLYLEGATASQPLLSITGTGATTFRNSTDSATAFQIQNVGGANQIQINNTDSNNNLITNPSAEVNLTGWNGRTGATLSRTTTAANVYYGVGAVQSVNTATAGAGINYPIQLSPNTTYAIRAMLKMTSNATVTFGYAADGADEVTWADNTDYPGQAGTSWYAIEYSFTTPGTVNPAAYVFIKQNDATARTMYIDGLRAEVGNTDYMYREGKINIGSSATQVVIGGSPSNVNDSDASLFVQGTRFAKGLVVRSTPENDLGSPHPFQVQDANGSVMLDVDPIFAGTNVYGGSGFWGSAALNVNVNDGLAGSAHGLVVTGTWGVVEQTADLLEIRSGTGGGRTDQDMFAVAGAGAVTAQNYTNSTAAFRILNAGGGEMFNVDTSNNLMTLLGLTSGGFAASSWTTQSSIFGTGLTNAPVVTSNGYIYSIGGRTTPTTSTASATVNYAKINADGSVGTWSATTSLPSARACCIRQR